MSKNKKIFIGAMLLAATALLSAVYIVPSDYDDVKASLNSKTQILITGASTPSSNTYRVVTATNPAPGVLTTFKCAVVQKAQCANGAPNIFVALTSANAVSNANQGVAIVGVQVKVEDVTATTYKVCTAIAADDGNVYFTGLTAGNGFVILEVDQRCP